MQNYTAGDAAYTRLNLYGHMLEMLNMNIRGAAANGIEKKEILSVVTLIRTSAEEESVTQQISVKKQKEIVVLADNVLDNMMREYNNLERGK